jgi:DNA-binding FadR family transcriptional regulator
MAVAEALPIAKHSTVVEAIAEGLIRYIAENRLQPGDRLPSERKLVEMVGASRLPLREALCVLKGLGLVESKHGKGVFVKRLDLAALFGMLSPLLKSHADIEVPHLFQARLHLEGSIAEVAAVERTEENLRALARALDGMRRNVRNRRAYERYDLDFHQELARSSGNPIFHVFMVSIVDLLRELQFLYRDSVEIREAAIAEHQEVLDAVAAHDGPRAAAALRKHIQNATQRT